MRLGLSWLVGAQITNFGALVPYTTIKSFIRALLNRNLTRRLIAEQASYAWLKSFASPTEHDFCGLREIFDPRSHWRGACLSRFSDAEKVREGDALRAQTTQAPQLRRTEEDAEGVHFHERFNMMSPQIPKSFGFVAVDAAVMVVRTKTT